MIHPLLIYEIVQFFCLRLEVGVKQSFAFTLDKLLFFSFLLVRVEFCVISTQTGSEKRLDCSAFELIKLAALIRLTNEMLLLRLEILFEAFMASRISSISFKINSTTVLNIFDTLTLFFALDSM